MKKIGSFDAAVVLPRVRTSIQQENACRGLRWLRGSIKVSNLLWRISCLLDYFKISEFSILLFSPDAKRTPSTSDSTLTKPEYQKSLDMSGWFGWVQMADWFRPSELIRTTPTKPSLIRYFPNSDPAYFPVRVGFGVRSASTFGQNCKLC